MRLRRPRASGGAHDKGQARSQATRRASGERASASYVSRLAGPPLGPRLAASDAGAPAAPDWKWAQQWRVDDGPKSRLRSAAQQKKSPKTSTTSSSSSLSSSCCCSLVGMKRTRPTSRAISLLKQPNKLFKPNQIKRQQSQQQRPARMLPRLADRSEPGWPLSNHQQGASSSSSGPHLQENHSSNIGSIRMDTTDEMEAIKRVSREMTWSWDETSCMHSMGKCQLNPDDKMEVCFHPLGSDSTAACRSAKPLTRNGNYYYWELTVSEKCYGTSVMFGLCTLRQTMHTLDFCNLIGLDQFGWSLSHKGLIWHKGLVSQYTANFPANEQVTIGLLFNTMRGELSYFMNGRNLGVAFCGLNDVHDELYPVVGSTAKNTKVRITGAYCGYVSLLERSCFTILKSHSRNIEQLLEYLHRHRLPSNLVDYLSQALLQSKQTNSTLAENANDNCNYKPSRSIR